MFDFRKSFATFVAAASLAGLLGAAPAEAQTLKVVMHSDVKILDPIWTTAYIQRNHGYMVWDTLFAMDEKFDVKPQMVDKYDVSADQLTWSFTLRDGLEWHDGKPVTPEDCIASIKRWAARDSMGQKMMGSVLDFEVVDAKTFKMKMKEPYGLVLQSLGKPSSNVPFMMPKRVAETDPMQQIKVEDVIGSGPFIFKADEWKPGEKTVYVKNTKYKPRPEPPSGLSGGKVVKLDRVEWIWIPDVQTQIAALQNGEIDMIEAPGHDLLPLLAADKNINLLNSNPTGNQYTFRFNSTAKPFDNPKIRHAVFVAFAQEEFLKATIGDPQWFKVCKAQMERAGFKVDLVAMDWQTLVARRTKKEPPDKGGWHAFLTSWVAADILNPVMAGFFNASCDKAMFGWTCDETIEKFRDQFAKETDPAKQKEIVENLQKYWVDHPTHINVGQWYAPLARRNNVEGNLIAPAPVFWNVTKK